MRRTLNPENRVSGILNLAVAIALCVFGLRTVNAQTFVMSNGSANSCSGVFYDSGGASGNYGNNENFVFTICPDAGPSSGGNTEISFTAWAVQPGTADVLNVYNGSSTSDPLVISGDGASSLTGAQVSASGTTGCLTFEWISNGSGSAPGWEAEIITVQNPGESQVTTICTDQGSFNLIDLLGGNPDAGGTWTDPSNNAHSNIFDPSVDPGGVWTYTILGGAGCNNVSSTVTITLVTAPEAGSNGSVSFCETDAPVALIGFLGGSPDPGGTWSNSNGSHSGTIDPATDPGGLYTYTVSGSPPCSDATALLAVSILNAPYAGTNGSILICSDDSPFNLFALLGNNPDVGGVWTDGGGNPHPVTYTPGSSLPGVYTYFIAGQAPCVSSSATVTVTQSEATDAGISNAITLCSDEAAFTLTSQLAGSPDVGGTWTFGGVVVPDSFDPASDTPGIYTYTVPAVAPCVDAVSTLSIAVNTATDAGNSATEDVCSNDPSFQLFAVLGGTPQTGGVWNDPSGNAHSGTFTPGVSLGGIYTYTVAGIAPCVDDVATVTINQTLAPNAGSNSSIVLCSDDAPLNLFDEIGGNPDGNGVWTDPDGNVYTDPFDPGTDQTGVYTYTVAGIGPCNDDFTTVSVQVNQAPNAGLSASIDLCSDTTSLDLFDVLGGNPDLTGNWQDPANNSFNGLFDPLTSSPGVYTYTVAGLAPCVDAVATVTVSLTTAPEAGLNGNLVVCSDDPIVPLFNQLGGNPDNGGQWFRPNGNPFNGNYNPLNNPGGIYTYVVTGSGVCANDTAIVQVVRNLATNAGTNGTITVCDTEGQFALFSVLGGTPQNTGNWLDPNGALVGSDFTPGVSTPGVYTYVVQGTAPCVNDTATAEIIVSVSPDAGSNSNLTICGSDAPFNLFDALGGTPNAGGIWDFGGAAHSVIYDPTFDGTGVYTYTVSGTAPCANVSASVIILEEDPSDAGADASLTICESDAPVNLFSILGGSPDAGGSWASPSPGAFIGVFDPTVNVGGTYIYTVNGTAPCPNVSASINVTLVPSPLSGDPASLSVCPDVAQIDLFNVLAGSFDLGGTWSDDDNTGQLSGSILSPNGLANGNYEFTYTVNGNGTCSNQSTTVTITIVGSLNAGQNSLVPVCGNEQNFDLITGLNGAPQSGGVWSDDDNTNALTAGILNASNLAAGLYDFTYFLAGSQGCSSDAATLTVNILSAPNAGVNDNISVCNSSPAFDMTNELAGNPASNGVWLDPNDVGHSNVFNPNVDISGVYTYVVQASAPCENDTSELTVNLVAAPNAGNNNAISICSNQGAFNLLDSITGNPDITGVWTDPNGLTHSGTFFPGSDASGAYLYTVAGNFPCASDLAVLNITVTNPPQAGASTSVTFCSNDAPSLLFSFLSGASPGGTWEDAQGNPFSGVFFPGITSPDVYTYTVIGQSGCADQSATVEVFVNAQANAGSSVTENVCVSSGTVNLFSLLTGAPQSGGTWTDPAGNPHSGQFISTSDLPGPYKYLVSGTLPCGNDSSIVSISVSPQPSAGQSTLLSICDNEPPFSLLAQLGGTPDLNGSWIGPNLMPTTGFYVVGNSTPGTYTYTVVGNGLCPDASSTVTIVESQSLMAGFSNSISVCENDGSLDLFTVILGNPDLGGVWTDPSGNLHSGNFVPSSDAPGAYQYLIAGAAPCEADSSTIIVQVDPVPNAGINSIISICDNETPFTMFSVLSGNPDVTGFWSGPAPSTALVNGIYQPGITAPGVYTYTVFSTGACAQAQSQLTISESAAPNAGCETIQILCSANFGSGSFNLIDYLDCAPDPGGFWLDPNSQPYNGIFQIGSSVDGLYTYVVPGNAPCMNDTATLSISVTIASDAGIPSAQTICSSDAPVSLISLLLGTPDSSGFWFNPDSLFHGAVFDPTSDQPGTYTYYVSANVPCQDATATVQISVLDSANAGANGLLTTCTSESAFDLAQGLVGADLGGQWIDLDATGALSGSDVDATSLATGVYEFAYVAAGGGSCENDTSFFELTVASTFFAGVDSSVVVCESQTGVNLFNYLGSNAQFGGSWSSLDGYNQPGLTNGIFEPTTVTPLTNWTFVYKLNGLGGCAADSAFVIMFVESGPDAGGTCAQSTCTNGPPIVLSNCLSNPDAGGQWFSSNGTLMLSDTLYPAIDTSDVFTYVVPAVGNCPADTGFANITITPQVDAGDPFTQIFVCSNDFPFAMVDSLGGTPNLGGSWGAQGCTSPFSSTFNPSIDPSGQYCYIVPGQGACPSATAILDIIVDQAPEAGIDGSVAVCSSEPPFALFFELSGSAQLGGQWYNPSDMPHSGTLDPATDSTGIYTYVVFGSGACENDSAIVDVTISQAPNAGDTTVLDTCFLINTLNLFDALDGNPTPGGSWVAPAGILLSGDTLGVLGLAPNSYNFVYTVNGTGPCTSSSALLTVDFTTGGAQAGNDGFASVCSTAGLFDLSSILIGNADPGGTWNMLTGNPGCLTDSILNVPCLLPDSTYGFYYVVVEPGCGSDTAFIDLQIVDSPNLGSTISVNVCETDPTFSILDLLPAGADSTGVWTGPLGNSVTPIYDPGVSKEGEYLYVVAPTPPCPLDTLIIEINDFEVPNAGLDAFLSGCEGDFNTNLLGWLGATDSSGIWNDLDGSGAIAQNGTFSYLGLDPGLYGFEYVVSNIGCGSDTAYATVNVLIGVEIENLSFDCDMDNWSYTATFDILYGDPSSYAVTGANGVLTAGNPFTFTTEAMLLYDSLNLTVTGGFCGFADLDTVSSCDFGSLVFVPESFSPNGDGINDYFEIQGIEGFPANTIHIYNRWGDLIYNQAGYDNSSVKWDGASVDALIPGDAPAGTYFYVLELGIEGADVVKGYVYLNK